MTGEYEHNIDSKGRLFIPAKLREALGEGFYVCKGLDSCLFVYSRQSWEDLEGRIAALPLSKARQIQRLLYPTAMKGETDAQGRILLTQKLRDYAGLIKSATIIGVGGHAEIWDSDRWNEHNADLTAETLEDAMDMLGF